MARLPVAASALLGRDAEVDDVVTALRAEARLVVLTGPPGVGKTRLAVEVATRLGAATAGDVAWVDLTAVRDPAVVVDEIVHACGVAHVGALEGRELLVVLDNCEHLLDAAPQVAALLATAPGLRVLATSRERLRVASEVEHPVHPLPMPEPNAAGDLRALAANPAVALVLARAPAYVDLTARTARPLVDIVRRLDGLPLALEFAAARLRVFTPGELAFRLVDHTGDLAGAARDAPARHRDLRAAIAWSHDLLPHTERAVFRRLSVFESGWTLGAAEAVAGGPDAPDVLAALESLLDKSLVRRADGESLADEAPARFTMLASLREYAAEQLDAHGEGEPTRRRHRDWFAEVARVWEATIGTGEEDMTWDLSGLVRGDLESALAVARNADDGTGAEAVAWLTAALHWFWYTRGSPLRVAGLVPGAADLAAASPDARAAVLVATGAVALATGDVGAARERLEAGYALSVPRADRRRTAFATAFLGHVDRELRRFDDAAGHYRQARAIYQELGNDRGVAWADYDLGLLAAERGALEQAGSLLQGALAHFETLDYPWAVAVAACGLASVAAAAGDADRAAALGLRAYALHAAVGDVRGEAQSLEVLADVALVRGAAATAARLLGAGAARRERVAARATEAEHARAVRAAAAVGRLLGVAEAEREQRAGRTLDDPAVRDLVDRLAGAEATPTVGLTARQLEVGALVAAGHTNRRIARELGISEKTAELHVRNTMQRLGVQNRAGVAAWVARREGPH